MVGLAIVLIAIGILYFLYQAGRIYKNEADVNERYGLLEIAYIDKKAKDKELNLDLTKAKLRTLASFESKPKFRKLIKQEILRDFFEHTPEEKHE